MSDALKLKLPIAVKELQAQLLFHKSPEESFRSLIKQKHENSN